MNLSGTPKSSILIGISIINRPFWGTTILGNTHVDSMNLPLEASPRLSRSDSYRATVPPSMTEAAWFSGLPARRKNGLG